MGKREAEARPVHRLTLRAERGHPDPVVAMRRLLKAAKRVYGYECIDLGGESKTEKGVCDVRD